MLSACQLMVIFCVTDGMTSLRCYSYFIILFLIILLVYFLEPFVCTDVIVLRLLFIYFQFWEGVQDSIPKMWQVVFSNISI